MFDTKYLNELRHFEIEQLVQLIPPGSRVLEFGAGTGEQARVLADHGFDVIAIDLPDSDYSAKRVFPVQDYDGRHIPVADHSVDVIFSSNVLEHVENLPVILREFRRILKQDGFGLHLMPTPSWRFWSFATGVVAAFQSAGLLAKHVVMPPPGKTRREATKRDIRVIGAGLIPVGHGTSPEGLSELWTFSPAWWRRTFKRNGFSVSSDRPFGLFYTGSMTFGGSLSFDKRKKLSGILGSATHLYEIRPEREPRD